MESAQQSWQERSNLDPDTAQLVDEVAMALVNKLHPTPLRSRNDYSESVLVDPQGEPLSKSFDEPKSYFIDPNDMLGGTGMNYVYPPTQVTYETLRLLAERVPVCSCVILTRVNQVASFCRAPRNKYDIGFKVRPIGKFDDRELTPSEKSKSEDIETFLRWTGNEYNEGRDDFQTFVKKLVRDRLYYDQACFEKVASRDGGLASFHAIPSESIRIAIPKNAQATPPSERDVRHDVKYVQIINSQPIRDYTHRELAFLIANPRTNLHINGYGFPETEMMLTTAMALLWAEEWNRNIFKQGSTLKGILNVKGSFAKNKFLDLKREFQTKFTGVHNAHKNGIVNVDELQWIALQLSNTEMGFQSWIEYLIKLTCAFYLIDPAEVNFDLRGSSQQQPIFMSGNEAQQKISRDRGLSPLLQYVEDAVNKHIVWRIDPRYMFGFVGLNAKTQEQAIELASKEVSSKLTLNEVRALDDLPPVKGGDIVLNAIYTGRLAALDQQQAGGGMPGMPPGAAPGMPGQPPDGQQPPQSGQQQPGNPYDQLQPGPPAAEDKQAGANLKAASKDKDESSSSGASPVPKKVRRVLARNDWENSSLFMSQDKRSAAGTDLVKSLFGQDATGDTYDEV